MLINSVNRFTCFVALLFLLSTVCASAQVAVAPLELVRQQFLSSTGIPLANGCLTLNATGTSNPQAIYVDSSGTFQAPNPYQLDAAGESNIWLSNTGYDLTLYAGVPNTSCSVSLGAQVWQQRNINPFAIINGGSNYIVASGTVDPSGVAGELAYRSDIPCFRGFTTIWDCFVTLTATQTLTNKTLTSPTITTPILNGTPSGTSLQGGGAKLMTAGTVAGTGATLCTDGTQAATTSGCVVQLPNVVYNTASAQFTATTALIPMVTPTANFTYRFSGYLDQTILGAACAGTSTYQLVLSWQDPNGAGVVTDNITWSKNGAVANTASIVNNGTVGNISGNMVPYTLRAKGSTSIGYSFTVVPGGACAPPPTVQFYPVLEQLSVN